MKVSLTKSEINHILTLLNMNEEDGCYYGKKHQYWVRAKKIRNKLGVK